MTNPASLVLALPNTFISCVQCFKYIHAGRSLNESYDAKLLKLNSMGLRLARWGKAVGLDNPTADISDPQAESLLRNILDLLEKARNKAETFRPQETTDTADPAEQNSPERDLCLIMQRWMCQRIAGVQELITRAHWVISGMDDFDKLLEDIGKLLDRLINENQPIVTVYERLCEEEVSGLEDNLLLILQRIAQGNDSMLSEVVVKLISFRKSQGHLFSGWEFNGTAELKIRAGDTVRNGLDPPKPRVRGHRFVNFKIMGAGQFEIGDNYLREEY
jgi:hypothetical protein